MTETPMQDQLIELAKTIQAERGCSFSEAVDRAERKMAPAPDIPEAFEVSIQVKPRVARWILSEFAPTATHTTEQRLAAYLEIVLNRARITAVSASRDDGEITEGRAVTLTRQKFEQQKG